MVSKASPLVGILALQGDVREHEAALCDLGARSKEIRRPSDLEGIDALVLPGGESTTLSMLMLSSGLVQPMTELLKSNLPVLGTCAGMILLASDIEDGRPDQISFGLLDISVRRNGFGRQVSSFEEDLEFDGSDVPMRAIFIRAPLVTRKGEDVEVLAYGSFGGSSAQVPVALRQGNVMATAFHPELTHDGRVHGELLKMCVSVERSSTGSTR